MKDEPIDDTIYDFDEDEIKTATEFKESYSAWSSGAMSVALNEKWQARLFNAGVKMLTRGGAKAAATGAAEVAVKKPNILRRAATGVATTARGVKDEVVNVAKNPSKLVKVRPDKPLDPTNKRVFDWARNPNDYNARRSVGLGAARSSSYADTALKTAEANLAAAKTSAEKGGKAVRTSSWNPFASKVTANVNDIKKYEDGVAAAKTASTAAAKTAEELKYGSGIGSAAARASIGKRPITSVATGAGLAGSAAYYNYDTLKNDITDPQGKEIAAKQQELDQLYGYIGNMEQQQQQQPGFQMPQLGNAGKVAVAGAGVAAGVGLAYAAWQRAKQKKEESYYASGCSNLQGGQLASCIQSVNNLKLKNLQTVLSSCGPDQQCIQNTNAELDAVQQAMRENRMAD
jgi:hypothetical protein